MDGREVRHGWRVGALARGTGARVTVGRAPGGIILTI